MADEYECSDCKQIVDTIYFYRPLCEKCFKKQKDKDKNNCDNASIKILVSDVESAR